ncbi:hypothetical protein PR370_01870 [Mycobacterium marinum]|uniref:hypothetical protein n=1 Tax=Mycobacterium marinum TaxID=1781 RepID=UPI0023590483|nr:hypothetical protein [Mycobacterium marinum]MDC8980513.1 hypothetical protein [Mycobacterium marinum]MDC8998053.1 hypothetical protein [Mycobacterium marinum]MDC9008793.1 hypothetical protein [Mycobacterium marinum]
MTVPEFMRQDVFDENWPTIATEVKTILATKGKTRKRFRIVAVYETINNELLIEVFRTSLGPVVAYRAGWNSGRWSWRQQGDLRAAIMGVRQGRGDSKYDVQPLTGHPQQFFWVTSRRPIPGADRSAGVYHFPIAAASLSTHNSYGGLLAFR